MPQSSLRIRAYNVRFGDCVLISVGPKDDAKHILIDFGNAPGSVKNDGGLNDVFEPIAQDILEVTGGHIHLLVMTHEHLDHMEGFLSCRKLFEANDVSVDHVWMSVMSAPDYYDRFPGAERLKRARLRLAAQAHHWKQRWSSALPASTLTVLENNTLDASNLQRVDFVRSLAKNGNVHYLHRGSADINKRHGLGPSVKFSVLAPEEDATVYYGERARDHAWFSSLDARNLESRLQSSSTGGSGPDAPHHVDPDEFARLRDEIAELDGADLLAIDKAANNTSLVLQLEVGGKKLLFPGDAENESWEIMAEKNLLGEVDLLKVPHHGSPNGIPFRGSNPVLNKVLREDGKTVALLCTCRNVYGESLHTKIPQVDLVKKLRESCARVVDTEHDAALGEAVEFTL